MTKPDTLARALATVVAPEYVQADPVACAPYQIHGIVPGCTIAPASLEELAAVLRLAQEHGAAVAPWGGGTQQLLGHPPARLDLVVRTERLSQVLEHEPADLTISVGAGLPIGALRDYLAPHRQMLPLDPPLPARATIGGLLATAADGPRRLGYGTLRELLIGITVVEVGGRISRGGGMVVKNVSGFDMMKLYHGSFGTLAIIAAANFKLLPLPRAAATLLCRFGQPGAAFAMLDALHQTQLTPTAAEYLNQAALMELGFEGSCALALRAEGLPAAVERHMIDMAALAERHSASGTERLNHEQEAELWLRIADLSQAAELPANTALVKLVGQPATIETTVAQVEAFAQTHGGQALMSARALNGIVYARLPVPAQPQALAALPGLQWAAGTAPDLPYWGTEPAGFTLMQRIKAEFDPAGQLNPGRFIPGI